MLDVRVSEYVDQKIITITVINIQMSDLKLNQANKDSSRACSA